MALTRLPLTTGISGTLPIANGGTNVTTAADLANTGNLVLLNTATVSDDAEVIFDNTYFTDTYKIYKIIGDNIKVATDNHAMSFRISNDNSIFKSNNYARAGFGLSSNEASNTTGYRANNGSNSEAYITGIRHNIGNASGEKLNFELNLYNFRNSDAYKHYEFRSVFSNNSNYITSNFGVGGREGTDKVEAIKFFSPSSNISSGTFTLYGVKI